MINTGLNGRQRKGDFGVETQHQTLFLQNVVWGLYGHVVRRERYLNIFLKIHMQ